MMTKQIVLLMNFKKMVLVIPGKQPTHLCMFLLGSMFVLPRLSCDARLCFVISGSAILPVQFYADREGQYECHLHLKSGYDLRTIIIEATVTAEQRVTEIEFKTQAIQSLTQNIPVVNK